MIFKKVDFLSPPITLYSNGILSHTSIVSGVIFIISLLITFAFGLYYFLKLIKKEEPEAYFFNHFIEDAGRFPMNSSSLFHFINLYNVKEPDTYKGFDFESFRLIGLNSYLSVYQANKNLSNYDHWLYGLCNNDTDTEGISNLITHQFYNISACIRKYFNSSEQKYYDTNDTVNFKWPEMAHGTYNPEKDFYLIILEKCDNTTLKIALGEEYQCKNIKSLDEYFESGAIHFYFVDQYVDVLNYKEPNRKYIYRIENKLSKESYSQNHLNFNPSKIKTQNGFIIDNIEEEYSYVYDRNDVIMTQFNSELNFGVGPPPKPRDNKSEIIFTDESQEERSEEMENNESDINVIYMAYYFWLENRMQNYGRKYKKIQDVLSDIGGISQVITIIAGFINQLYNNYIILCDTQVLLSSYSNFQTKKNKKIDNIKSSSSIKNKNLDLETNNSNNIEINSNGKIQNNEKQNVLTQSSDINNPIYIDEKKYKYEESYIDKDFEQDEEKVNQIITQPKFFDYLKHEIGFRKNEVLTQCEKVRKKIISEEYILKNCLIIDKLLKDNNIIMNEYQKNISITDIIK